jgi:lipopolysaccharide transport system permease protein
MAVSEKQDSTLPEEHSARRQLQAVPALHTTRIEPVRGWLSLHLKELWPYRELLYFFIWRDVKIRHKQTAIGATWAILQPLLTMIIFTLVFRRVAKIPSDDLPYPIFAYSGLLPWTLFAGGLNRSITSLVSQANLISKVYFPRILVPLAATISGVVDFAIASVLLLIMMFWYDIKPSVWSLTLPLFILLGLSAAFAVGLWLSALNVKYRDVGHAVPFLVQIWMFASPVAYPMSVVPEKWRLLYSLNPMAGVIEGFRWAAFRQEQPDFAVVGMSAALVVMLLGSGLIYFQRMEQTFADVV